MTLIQAAEKCQQESIKNSGLTAEEIQKQDGKIVNGYDVHKTCMPRPWVVLIRLD